MSSWIPSTVGNVLEMHALGLVVPPSAITKYSEDAMAGTIDHLLAVERSTAASLLVAGEGLRPTPAMIEVSDSVPLAGLVNGVLPLEVVERVVVAGHAIADQIGSLITRNIDPDDLTVEVDTTLVPGEQRPTGSPHQADTVPIAPIVELVNRIAGALALIVTSGPVSEATVNLATGLAGALREASVARTSEALTSVCAGDENDERWLVNRVLHGCLEEDSAAVLDAAGFVERVLEQAHDGPPPVLDALRYIRQIVRSETELRPFSDDEGSTAARGLLLFVLRPEIADVITWSEDEINAGERAIAVATALAGLRSGWRAMALKHRGAAHMPAWVRRQMANAVNAKTGSGIQPVRRDHPLKGHIDMDRTKQTMTHKSGNLLLDLRDAPAPTIRRRLLRGESAPELDRVLHHLVKESGWSDAVRSVVTTTAAFTTKMSDGSAVVAFEGPITVTEEIDRRVAVERVRTECSDEMIEELADRVLE